MLEFVWLIAVSKKLRLEGFLKMLLKNKAVVKLNFF